MGYGAYSHDAHMALISSRKDAGQQEVFVQRTCHQLMDPCGVKFRESRDSETHPNSLGIIFALDVSGSMETIPHALATGTLPAFMQTLLDAGVADPQVLFMAIGCAVGDSAPLQVGQFESTERLMDQWLTMMYLEGAGGGGNESYELAMYFASRHTDMDCVKKRGRRGYLFITGDEPPNPVVSREHVKRLIGDKIDADIPIVSIIEETQRTFEPFYLIPDPGRAQRVGRAWRDLLGDRVIAQAGPADTGYVAAGLVSLLEGGVPDLDGLVKKYRASGLAADRCADVARALTPFAATLKKNGAPVPALGSPRIPGGNTPSGYDR